MALPARLLERLSPEILREMGQAVSVAPAPALGTGTPLDAVLPDGGLPRGAVVELSVAGGAAQATAIALAACRSVHAQAREAGDPVPWCAFVDPSSTLHAPGVQAAGVSLERLLVVRIAADRAEAIGRVALRIAESGLFAVVAIDTLGVPGARLEVPLGAWQRVVRRIALAVEKSRTSVLLLTDRSARRPLPLPVALRLEIARPAPGRLSVQIAKERQGRIGPVRSIVWPERAGREPLAGDTNGIRVA
jgi:recombination protein RecA